MEFLKLEPGKQTFRVIQPVTMRYHYPVIMKPSGEHRILCVGQQTHCAICDMFKSTEKPRWQRWLEAVGNCLHRLRLRLTMAYCHVMIFLGFK
jgi:hypothetical protein